MTHRQRKALSEAPGGCEDACGMAAGGNLAFGQQDARKLPEVEHPVLDDASLSSVRVGKP